MQQARDALGGEAADAQDDRIRAEFAVDLLQGGGGTLGDELKGFHGRALQNVWIYSGTEMTRRDTSPPTRRDPGAPADRSANARLDARYDTLGMIHI